MKQENIKSLEDLIEYVEKDSKNRKDINEGNIVATNHGSGLKQQYNAFVQNGNNKFFILFQETITDKNTGDENSVIRKAHFENEKLVKIN